MTRNLDLWACACASVLRVYDKSYCRRFKVRALHADNILKWTAPTAISALGEAYAYTSNACVNVRYWRKDPRVKRRRHDSAITSTAVCTLSQQYLRQLGSGEGNALANNAWIWNWLGTAHGCIRATVYVHDAFFIFLLIIVPWKLTSYFFKQQNIMAELACLEGVGSFLCILGSRTTRRSASHPD